VPQILSHRQNVAAGVRLHGVHRNSLTAEPRPLEAVCGGSNCCPRIVKGENLPVREAFGRHFIGASLAQTYSVPFAGSAKINASAIGLYFVPVASQGVPSELSAHGEPQ